MPTEYASQRDPNGSQSHTSCAPNGHSYKANIPFHNLEWCSEDGDWRITSQKPVFSTWYLIYHNGQQVGHTYDIFGEALDYVIAHA